MRKEKLNKEKKKDDSYWINPVNRFNIIFIDIQLLFTILTIIFAVLYLFNHQMELYFELSLIADLFIMAFNNYKIYKRSKMTIIYLIVAILLLICMVI